MIKATTRQSKFHINRHRIEVSEAMCAQLVLDHAALGNRSETTQRTTAVRFRSTVGSTLVVHAFSDNGCETGFP